MKGLSFLILFLFIVALLVAGVHATDGKEWYYKGKDSLSAGNYKEALAAYDNAIETGNASEYEDTWLKNAWSNKGYCLMKLGRYKEALQAFNTTLQIDPDDPHVLAEKASLLLDIGNNYVDYGRCKEALDAYENALATCPDEFKDETNKKIKLAKECLEDT